MIQHGKKMKKENVLQGRNTFYQSRAVRDGGGVKAYNEKRFELGVLQKNIRY